MPHRFYVAPARVAAALAALAGGCASPAPPPVRAPAAPAVAGLPYQAEIDLAFRYVAEALEDPAIFSEPRIFDDVVARLTTAFPGVVVCTRAPLGGWSLRAASGATTSIAAPRGLVELKAAMVGALSFFYQALQAAVPGPPHEGRLAPERFALAGLFCNLDRETTLLTPADMKSALRPLMKNWERWAQAAKGDRPTPEAARCTRPLPSALALAPDSVADLEFYGAGTHMTVGFARDLRRRIEGANGGSLEALRGIILDLRGSADGLYAEALATADLFLPAGPAFVLRRANGHEPHEDTTKDDNADRSTPLVLLVDGATSGGAEMLAALLQERGRALIIGARTLGRGAAQAVLALAFEHGAVRLTLARVETAGGHRIDDQGVTPDVTVGDAKSPAAPSASVTSSRGDVGAPVRFAHRVLATARSRDREGLLDAARAVAAHDRPLTPP